MSHPGPPDPGPRGVVVGVLSLAVAAFLVLMAVREVADRHTDRDPSPSPPVTSTAPPP